MNIKEMAAVSPYPQVTSPGFDAVPSYNNQAYLPTSSDDFSKPPPYPPQFPPPPGTAGYYPQAPTMYTSQGQQQTATVVVAAPPPVIVQQQVPHVSYIGMIILAVNVFVFGNVLFGLIAFILAVVAENTKISDAKRAQRLGKASMWVSIVGIIVTPVIIAIAVGVSIGTSANVASTQSSSVSRQVISKHITPRSCCTTYGYYYPGYGSECYASANSYSSYYSLASICCGSSEYYYYYSSPSYGYCYYYSYF